MIKLLMFYFTVLSIFKVLPLESEFLFNDISISLISTSPSEKFNIFSFGCLLTELGIKTSSMYAVALGTFALLNFSFIIIVLIKIFVNRKLSGTKSIFGKKFLRSAIFLVKCCFYVFFMDNLILIFNSFSPLLICVNIGDEKQTDFMKIC